MPFIRPPLEDAAHQIRLLRFTGESEQIACELTAVNISTCPQYAAISYTWGSPANAQTIDINGSKIKDNQNWHNALTQISLHLRSELRYFWLDSICINQDDLDEKALQVEMMADVYARAQAVFSCVGPHADESEVVLPMVKQMASWIRSQPPETRYSQAAATDHLSDLYTVNERYDLEAGRKSTEAYIAFGNRQYWQRM